MGILFASLSAIFYSFWFLLSKVSVNRTQNPLLAVSIFQWMTGLLFIPLFLIEKPEWQFSLESLALLIVAVFIYSFFNILGFKSFKYLDVSTTGIVSQLTVVVSFVGGLILFREAASFLKIAGVSLVILGNLIIHLKTGKAKKINAKGLILRVGASVMLGLGILIDAKNSSNFSIPLYGALTYFLPGFISYIFAKSNLAGLKADFKPNKLLFLAMSLMATFGYYFLIKSFTTDLDKTISAPINSSSSMLVVIWGIIFLKETDNMLKKIIAGIVVFLGVLFLSLT